MMVDWFGGTDKAEGRIFLGADNGESGEGGKKECECHFGRLDEVNVSDLCGF